MENNANMDDVVLIIPPTQEEAMLKIAEFSSAEIYGRGIIEAGILGRVFGIPVLVHNAAELDDAGNGYQQAIMAEKEGLAFGFQRRPNFDEEKAISYGTGAMLQAVDQLFGVKGCQLGVSSDKNVVAAGKSALVAKLAD